MSPSLTNDDIATITRLIKDGKNEQEIVSLVSQDPVSPFFFLENVKAISLL
jgi:hypothetical protein